MTYLNTHGECKDLRSLTGAICIRTEVHGTPIKWNGDQFFDMSACAWLMPGLHQNDAWTCVYN